MNKKTPVNLEQMNQFVLKKQHLTDKTKLDDILHIIKDIGGLHATNSTTPYLSLFSRTKSFTRDKLDDELYLKRMLGKIRCVRKTVYVLPKEWIPIAFNATKKIVASISEPHLFKYLGVTPREYKTTSKTIIQILKGRGMTAKEVKQEVGTMQNISGIINLMCDQMILIRGKPQKGWKSNLHTYYLFHETFPDIDLNMPSEDEAKASIVNQYITSYSPVTENDIVWWTGFQKGQIRKILDDNQDKLTYIQISELNKEVITPSAVFKSLDSTIPKTTTITLLPNLDPYLMGYKDRERYLNPEFYHYIFDRSGNATYTILLNGQIVGIWDFLEPKMKLFLFENLNSKIMNDIRSKAASIGQFISDKEVKIEKCSSMIPLTERTAGGVMSPLKYS